jgi:hypothetical protein
MTMLRTRPFRDRALGLAIAALVASGLSFLPTAGNAAQQTPTFAASYVSTSLAGGEPFVIYSHGTGNLVYSSHEGTTHFYKGGAADPSGDCDIHNTPPTGFLCSYDNQVNVWYSTNGGNSWSLSLKNPLATGFSDPSLTEDAGNNIYDAGIDLANDAVFASNDGGATFLAGTAQCHDGDRPWLAGGQPSQFFMSTDTVEGSGNGHEVFQGQVTSPLAITCSTNGIVDNGSYSNPRFPTTTSYSGFGQIYYDRADGSLIEPADFFDANGNVNGVGISVLNRASGFTGSFAPFEGVASPDGQLAHWPAIAIDSANTVYVVWDTQPRDANPSDPQNGCSPSTPNAIGGPSLLPNSIMLAYTTNKGVTWHGPYTIAHPGTTVLWPWIAAGAAGNISVTWYQANQVTDPDCDSASLVPGGQPTQWTVQVANIFGAQQALGHPVQAVNAIPPDALHPNGVLHVGGICQGGTTCVVTGQDRRLGDYFTNALDGNGCVMIATGDTEMPDPTTGGPLPISLPLFIHQTGGRSLTSTHSCPP